MNMWIESILRDDGKADYSLVLQHENLKHEFRIPIVASTDDEASRLLFRVGDSLAQGAKERVCFGSGVFDSTAHRSMIMAKKQEEDVTVFTFERRSNLPGKPITREDVEQMAQGLGGTLLKYFHRPASELHWESFELVVSIPRPKTKRKTVSKKQ